MNLSSSMRAYWLATVICMAAFMAGYDTGVAGGVLTMESFRDDYRYSQSQQTRVNALTVGLQLLGAFLSCFLIFPITAHIGRRKSIMLSAAVFLTGSTLETINSHSLHIWYIGRLLAGLGQGSCSVVATIYLAEMSPAESRGSLGSMYQWLFTLGIFCSYWMDLAVKRNLSQGTRQWQIPVGMQLLPAGLLLIGVFTLKESVRWLVKCGKTEEALESLFWIRGDNSAATMKEFEDIKQGVHREFLATEGLRRRELFLDPANRFRVFLASMVFFFQQATGATALAYFAPQFFKLLVGPGDKDLLLTAVFGGVKVVACTIFIFIIADRFGRRTLLIGGGLAMATCMLSTGLLYRYRPPPGDGTITTPGIVTILLLYANVSAFNWSWGTLPWAYVPEIFPTRIREVGVALGLSVHWLFSFIFTTATPYLLRDLGWGTFMLYAAMDASMALFTWMYVKETAGKSLEDMESIFESQARDVTIKVNASEAINDDGLRRRDASGYGTFDASDT